MAKIKKEKFVNSFKLYNYVMQEIWKLVTTLLFGIVLGYFVQKKSVENKKYFVLILIISMVVGLCNFFIGIIRIARKEEKRKNQVTQDVEKTNPEL